MKASIPAPTSFLFYNHGSNAPFRLPAGPTFVTKSSKSSGELAASPSLRSLALGDDAYAPFREALLIAKLQRAIYSRNEAGSFGLRSFSL